MGKKHVYFACRVAFNAPFGSIGPTTCPTCGEAVVVLAHRFRPPKKRDTAKWAVAKYLVAHGFYYQHIYTHPWGGHFMQYPDTMLAAQEFVKSYQAQASRNGVITNVPVATLRR
jgi:hypothetical protein